MRRILMAVAATAMVIAFPAAAFGEPPDASSSESESAWAVYSLELEGVGWAELYVSAYSASYSDGEFGDDEFSEAGFSIYGEGFDCYGFGEVPFDLDNRLSGATVSGELNGECYFYEPGDGEEGEGDGEFEALHEEDGEGEPDFVPITATLEVEFVGTGVKQNSNGFWREAGYRCSSHGSSRAATTDGTLTIDGADLLPGVIGLSAPEDAVLSRYQDSCQATGSPGPA